jgi:hypothetical protein
LDSSSCMDSFTHTRSNNGLFSSKIIKKLFFLKHQNPLPLLALFFILSNALSLAYGETICLNEQAPQDYVATSLTQSSNCGSLLRGTPNAMIVRHVRETSDRICLSPLPIPNNYVITRRFYDSVCVTNLDAIHNSAEISEAYPGINICLGPKIPDNYIISRFFYQTSCGGPDKNQLGNSAQITEPYSGASSCMHTQIPSGFVIDRTLYSSNQYTC